MKKFLISGLLALTLSSLVGCGYSINIETGDNNKRIDAYEKTDIIEKVDDYEIRIYKDKNTDIAYRVNTYRGIFDPVLGPDKQPVTLDEYKAIRGIK